VSHIIDELLKLADAGVMSDWYESRIERRHTNPADRPNWREGIKKFLNATMDEVRLQRASDLARDTLRLPAFDEVIPFRVAVLRREAGADISYDKQRDHSAHTIYNWLLGWLFYQHSDSLRQAMKDATKARGLSEGGLNRTPVEAFGDVWTYASILHDIGYLFEGGIGRLAWEPHHETAKRGALVVNDFFYNRIWHEWEIYSAADRQLIRKCDYEFLTLPTDGSLGGIIEGLQKMGGLDPLLEDVGKVVSNLPTLSGKHVNAFELWAAHYEHLGKKEMVKYVDHTQKAFANLAYNGLKAAGVRVIDHGVAGGLLLLQLITMYYGARSALSRSPVKWSSDESRERFMGKAGEVDYNPAFWWGGILWGTFATAFHNVQQTSPQQKLKLEDDPMAYLGILVDILQEWDRYAVQRGAVLAHEPALQGVDVPATVTAKGVLTVTLPTKRCEKAIEDLDKALQGWKDLLILEPSKDL
jgi:hypothetical protein